MRIIKMMKMEMNSSMGVLFRKKRKVEAIDPKKRYSETLKVEALVLRRMHWSDYVCRIFMAGRLSPSMNVIVMTKMGPSLSSLRQQLHAIGFIHRDIKPSNFAIGLSGEERGKIHLLDFGFAHAYLRWTSQGTLEHKPARPRAPFMGTDRYCSANVHNRNEQGRRDDMWSLFYTLIELMKGKLPWRSLHKTEILACKVRETPFLLDRCPWELYKMYQHIRSLDYTSRPDYALMRKVIDDVCERRGFRLDDPLDWQEGGRLCKNNPKLLQ
uniref:Protein kinase domain-containing protein n=1 Tax=Ditylenchus dipsaci TaxID=166011 RepID=A0A915EPI1_9BILA